MTDQNPQVNPQMQSQQPAQQPMQQPGQPVYQQPMQQPVYQEPAQPMYQQPMVNDSGSFGWAVLGFFFPIVGLILFIIWRQNKPKSAKVAGIGALVGFILGIVFSVGSNILLASMGPSYYYL